MLEYDVRKKLPLITEKTGKYENNNQLSKYFLDFENAIKENKERMLI